MLLSHESIMHGGPAPDESPESIATGSRFRCAFLPPEIAAAPANRRIRLHFQTVG